jgi:hypothetical protein
MKIKKDQYISINDCYNGIYFTSIIFEDAKVAITFPADPTEVCIGTYWWSEQRAAKIAASLAEKGIKMDTCKWDYFEVSPYTDRLRVRSFRHIKINKLLSYHLEWEDNLATDTQISHLDELARNAELPTIGEYYRNIQAEREATASFEKAAHSLALSWIDKRPTSKLLGKLKFDLETKLPLIHHHKHGWHYVVYLGDEKLYFRTFNAETMLRSFIVHAEEALVADKPIRFGYCFPEHMEAGITWQTSPVQD